MVSFVSKLLDAFCGIPVGRVLKIAIDRWGVRWELVGKIITIIKNNIIIIIRTFPESFAPEKFQCKIT